MRNLYEKIKGRLQFVFYRVCTWIFSYKRVGNGSISFIMRTSTSNEMHRALTLTTKEPETVAWIDGFSFPPDQGAVFYDVGANVGLYSLYAKARHPDLKIYCFEPEAQSFASLCQNIVINQFANIIPYQFAISDSEGLGNLFVSSMYAGAGAAALGSAYSFSRAKAAPLIQGVFKMSLDLLVQQEGLPIPNYLKIDVDGIEQKILQGAKSVLSDLRLFGVLIEFQFVDRADLTAAFALLEECGLKLKLTSEWVAEFDDFKSQNFIFERM